jgi:transposase InsO family protein/DNA-binding XRE family transcriptional regulator
VRDNIVEEIKRLNEMTGINKSRLISQLGISRQRYYDWENRYGKPNEHNRYIPKGHWLTPEEEEAIVRYYVEHYNELDGYRRLCYKMIDEDVVYATPSSVYRVLRRRGLLKKRGEVKVKENKKGMGYKQPSKVNEEWHTDIKYVNVMGKHLFLISVLDGYSRYVVSYELRGSMEDKDVELVIENGLNKYPDARPRIISDNGSQYKSKEYREYIKAVGLRHTYTSVNYPQSNGKIERYHRAIKEECIEKESMVSIEDARRVIDRYVEYYNTKRLHSALGYVTPKDVMEGRKEEIIKSREEKLRLGRQKRIEYYNKTYLTEKANLSNLR